jgi:hypothetical protein
MGEGGIEGWEGGRKEQETEQNCIIRLLMICTAHRTFVRAGCVTTIREQINVYRTSVGKH